MIVIRLSTLADRDRIQSLVRGLSPESRYQRFFCGIRELSARWLDYFVHHIPGIRATYLAVTRIADKEQVVGMAQCVVDPVSRTCEVAVVVDDAWQHRGIGTKLIDNAIEFATESGIRSVDGYVLANNEAVIRIAQKMGFQIRPTDTALISRASKRLTSKTAPSRVSQTPAANRDVSQLAA